MEELKLVFVAAGLESASKISNVESRKHFFRRTDLCINMGHFDLRSRLRLSNVNLYMYMPGSAIGTLPGIGCPPDNTVNAGTRVARKSEAKLRRW